MSENQVEIIAEIAQAHDGSLGIAHSYIDALSAAGVDTIKFQMHLAASESSDKETFRVNFSYEDKTRYDYWKRMEFTLDQWASLKSHCEDKGLNLLCSPFSMEAVDRLEKLNVKRYKIASGEISNLLMVEKICKTGKPILISSGMSTVDEISNLIRFIKSSGGNFEAAFQCTTAYPTPPEKYGLNIIPEWKKTFDCKVGLSDHPGEIYAGLAAAALGAELLEMHAVFDKTMFGPDASSSLEIADFEKLCHGVKSIRTALNHPVDKSDAKAFSDLKNLFGKTLSLRHDLAKGHVISFDDLESRKPGNQGIPASDYQRIIGKKLTRDISRVSFLQNEDLE